MMNIVAVLGMHRSGTSSLAGILKHSGINFYESNEFNRFNKRGNQEASVIVEANDNILSSAGFTWLTAEDSNNFSISDDDINKYSNYLKEADRAHRGKCIGFKDPRFTILCEYVIAQLQGQFNISYVGTYRHPNQVAMSITRRQKVLKYEEGYKSWFNYNSKLLEILKKNKSPLIYFSNMYNIYKLEVSLLINHVESEINQKLSINSGLKFFHTSLQNETSISNEKIPSECLSLLNELHEYRYNWLEKMI
tara:strand:- start:1937 stop:2686 length:750 start_codon:yes stop_codon:yes gene_type:complete